MRSSPLCSSCIPSDPDRVQSRECPQNPAGGAPYGGASYGGAAGGGGQQCYKVRPVAVAGFPRKS